jgi:hypothetical protein
LMNWVKNLDSKYRQRSDLISFIKWRTQSDWYNLNYTIVCKHGSSSITPLICWVFCKGGVSLISLYGGSVATATKAIYPGIESSSSSSSPSAFSSPSFAQSSNGILGYLERCRGNSSKTRKTNRSSWSGWLKIWVTVIMTSKFLISENMVQFDFSFISSFHFHWRSHKSFESIQRIFFQHLSNHLSRFCMQKFITNLKSS